MSRAGCITENTSHPFNDARIHRVFTEAWRGRDGSSPDRSRIVVALAHTLAWRPWLPEAEAMLDAAELGRIRRRRALRDREQLVLAYALHRGLLGALLGLEPERVPLFRDERGCPRLEGDAVATSLSHADGAVAIAVSRAPVGVDIEPRKRESVMAEIAARLCHPSELRVIEAMSEGRRPASWLGLWVRKEALLKAAGSGFDIEPDAFEAADESIVQLPAQPGARASGPFAVGMVDAGAGWCAAVAGTPGAQVEYGWTGPHGVLRYHTLGLARPAGRDAATAIPTTERKA